ncbi:YafY family protein [Psychromarinibacter sp. C21-152]|uniref:YafY family protein n=1 Tax=Psychromarinibacter sediminicola TaxID=3033385 RepID=A0AAE3NQ76_9RHOB|nr:YafY family protein [Psychromarinibacter sediminicola]MDF0601513.1 YafY family protein [Psychromarinibacter sediminicola]
MQRLNRLFEVIQILRASPRPLRAEDLSDQLEVSPRTIYRDIAALQAMGTPIEGEAGIGYVMRRGYDLPPLNFDAEELEALRVGLSMLARSGDTGLQRAARRVCDKVAALNAPAEWLQVAPWGVPPDDPANGCTELTVFRQAVREERKLSILYRDGDGVETCRIIRPVALVYHIECVMVAAWCELRSGFRHFRTDRIWACKPLEDRFAGQGDALRALWRESEGVGYVS